MFVREVVGRGIASRGLQLDRPVLSLCSAFSSHRCLRAPHLYTEVIDAPTASRAGAARRRRAVSSGDGRLPAAAAAPDAARPAQPPITPAARRTVDLHDADDFLLAEQATSRDYFKVKLYTGTSNMDKINSGRLQQVTIGLGW